MSFFFLLSYRRLSSFTACRSHSQTQKFTTFASVNSFWESWAKRAINERLRWEEKLWKLAVSWFLEGLITAVWDQPSSRMGLETDRRTDMRLNDGSASAQVTATLSLNTHTHTVSHTFVSSFVKWGFFPKADFSSKLVVLARQTVRFMGKTESCGLSIFRENAMFSGCALLRDVLRCESKKIEYDSTWEFGWTSRGMQFTHCHWSWGKIT